MSGVFGLGGGLILLLVLIHYFDTGLAMVIHGLFSIFVCGHRGILNFDKIDFKLAVNFSLGYFFAFLVLSQFNILLAKETIVYAIGLFAVSSLFINSAPIDITKMKSCVFASTIIGYLSLTVGSSGPLFNVLFLNKKLDKEKVIATKSAIAVVTLSIKTFYFFNTIPQSSDYTELYWLIPLFVLHGMLGTNWAESSRKHISERHFYNSGRIITAITGVFCIFRELL